MTKYTLDLAIKCNDEIGVSTFEYDHTQQLYVPKSNGYQPFNGTHKGFREAVRCAWHRDASELFPDEVVSIVASELKNEAITVKDWVKKIEQESFHSIPILSKGGFSPSFSDSFNLAGKNIIKINLHDALNDILQGFEANKEYPYKAIDMQTEQVTLDSIGGIAIIIPAILLTSSKFIRNLVHLKENSND